MSKTNITVKMRSDGTVVRVLQDGSEEPLAPQSAMAAGELGRQLDPDNVPLEAADFKRMKAVPRVKVIRRALGLTQEQFAARFQIPLGTLRDWEQGRSEPDQTVRAYLNAIARDPTGVVAGPTNDVRQAGIEVRDSRDPFIKGVTTGQIRSHAGRELVGIRLFNGEIKFVPFDSVELLPKHETRSEAFAAHRIGGASELVRYLLAEKVSGRLTDVYYSMESGRAKFFPHQFRPVLNFVESTIGRLLVADEVGLGKTISAIYIWKELQARTGARRLLVVCPAVLREKWRSELRDRFSIEARIVDASDLIEELETVGRDPSRGFALVGGLEGLRSRRRTDESSSRPRQRLMRLIQENPSSSEFSLFDLVVVDEAHAARNPKTANHHFVESLRDAAAHLVLLTATPVQTHSENLFNLLKLIDPDRFVTLDTFEQARRANISIIEAVNALLSVPSDYEAFQRHLERASKEPLFQRDTILIGLARDSNREWDYAAKIRLAKTLESRSLLADVMVRTRKREAFKDRVKRVPWVLNVSLSNEERQLYAKLSRRTRDIARQKSVEAPAAFILIGKQRQLASSIPAAIEAWKSKKDFQELLWEDLGVDLTETEEADDVPLKDLLEGYDFERGDSKYNVFSQAIRDRLREQPSEKIVVFAFFRGTLAYLQRRLEAEGIGCACIHGGMGTRTIDDEEVDAKTAEIARFADPQGPSILLSSEVGSEGIDLQFARVIFNYDLPWNPMRVEQRIGRIDRMGQKASRISIGHFATTGTIDDQIINRLYERINVFKESIGDLDEIFGERIQTIVMDYFREKLSAEEAEGQIEQNLLAAESYKQETERLDREAPALAGHADFILRSISNSHLAGRFMRPDDLRRYVTDFLHERYPGSSLEYDLQYPGHFRIDLSPNARDALAAFVEEERPSRRTQLLASSVLVSFDVNVSPSGRLRAEILDVTHPLILWIRKVRSTEAHDLVPAVAVEVEAKNAGIVPGVYVFATDHWRMEGVRKQLTIQHAVLSVETGQLLEQDDAEKLIDSAVQHGSSADVDSLSSVHDTLINAFRASERVIEDRFLSEMASFESENVNRVAQARQLVIARSDRKLQQLKSILEQQLRFRDERQRRVIPLTQARIRRAQEDKDKQLARIERQGRVESGFRPVLGGVIFVKP